MNCTQYGTNYLICKEPAVIIRDFTLLAQTEDLRSKGRNPVTVLIPDAYLEIHNLFQIRKERHFLLNILPVGAGRFKVRMVTSVWLNCPPATTRRSSRRALMISMRLCAIPRRFSSGESCWLALKTKCFFPVSRNFVRTNRYLCQDYFYLLYKGFFAKIWEVLFFLSMSIFFVNFQQKKSTSS